MPDFSKRSDAQEIMDNLQCSGEVVNQTLRELEVINKLLGGNYVTINGVAKLLTERNVTSVSIADLGCGSGDILKLIRLWCNKNKIHAVLTGVDANVSIVDYATSHTPVNHNIQYKALNIFSEEFSLQRYDIITGTLFFHHFSNEQLSSFFRQLKNQVNIGIIINDIHRHWFAFYSIQWLTKFFSKSSMVKYDAPLSVLRAFKKNELIEILKKAEIHNYSIRWMWAFRWQVVIKA